MSPTTWGVRYTKSKSGYTLAELKELTRLTKLTELNSVTVDLFCLWNLSQIVFNPSILNKENYLFFSCSTYIRRSSQDWNKTQKLARLKTQARLIWTECLRPHTALVQWSYIYMKKNIMKKRNRRRRETINFLKPCSLFVADLPCKNSRNLGFMQV